jgi:hypothetical protein
MSVIPSTETAGHFRNHLLGFGAFLAVLVAGLLTTLIPSAGVSLLLFVPAIFFVGRAVLRLMKEANAFKAHGELELVLDEPPALGGRLKGQLVVPRYAPRIDQLAAELACTVLVSRGRSRPAFQTAILHAHHEPAGSVFEIDLAVPERGLPSGKQQQGYVEWKLTLKGEGQRRSTLERSFELEIY